MNDRERGAFRSFMMVIGGLIMLLSGTCSVFFLSKNFDMLLPTMIVGGIPFLMGFLIFVLAKGKSK